MPAWTVLDHTADLALEARGDSEAQALESLLQGLLTQITDPGAVRPRESSRFRIEGLDREECLVSVLGEVLYRINEKGRLFSRFEVTGLTDRHVELIAFGEPRDASRHPFDLEVKAATYHDLYSGRTDPDGPWTIRVIFDV